MTTYSNEKLQPAVCPLLPLGQHYPALVTWDIGSGDILTALVTWDIGSGDMHTNS